MYQHAKFHYQSLEQMQEDITQKNLNIPASKDIRILTQSLTIGKKTLPNRMAVNPMEGCDGMLDGRPDELTYRRYERFARGGAGLLWFEATAVDAKGRANPRQLYLDANTQSAFEQLLKRSLVAAQQEFGDSHRPYTVLQLTHSGRYSKPEGKYAPVRAVSNPYLDSEAAEKIPLITDEQIEALEDKYVKAAVMAAEIGFDAVDIKSCHGYLIAELLSAYTRKGKYGGDFTNRTRLLCNIIDKINQKLAGKIDIVVRMNAYDAVPWPYGWGVNKEDFRKPDFSEPQRLAQMLAEKGVTLINVSAGNPYYNPHVGRPYDFGGYIPPYHPLEHAQILLAAAREIQAVVPETIVLGTGFSWLRQLGPHVAAACIEAGWFKLAGFGRQSFAYPDFSRDILVNGCMQKNKVCISCSKCTVIMRDGGCTGCVIRDAAVYGPIYQQGRQGKPPCESDRIAEHI